MKRPLAVVGTLAVTAGLLAGTLVAPTLAGASSHREAPGISNDPQADNTDLYAFVSPDKPDTVTFIANYIPLQDPAGGPNFSTFSDNVLYEINIDNVGDGNDHIVYQFRFTSTLVNGNTFLYNTGQLTSPNDPDLSMPQTYTVTRIENGKATRLDKNVDLRVPPVNVGTRSEPDYEAQIGSKAVFTLNNGARVFAGQRDDPFFVDLGSIFDLGGLRPFNALHVIPLPNEAGRDALQGMNVHSIALQVPITDLTADHKAPTSAGDPRAIIGVYASASRQQMTVLNAGGLGNDRENGPFVQVSRLGEPLINEVIIPLKDKDRWNRAEPSDDIHFLNNYKTPELAGLINFLYPGLPDVPTTDRRDLSTVLLTGIPGLNQPPNVNKADLLRLNMMIAPSSPDPNAVNRLGAMGGQFDGFPNGRRLADDIVDIELRAVACGYGDILAGALGLCNLSPNNQIGDGVDKNDVPFLTQFPYVASPHSGYTVKPLSE